MVPGNLAGKGLLAMLTLSLVNPEEMTTKNRKKQANPRHLWLSNSGCQTIKQL